MHKSEWEQLFAPHILERGKYYALEGRVTELLDCDNTITATVEGTDYYHVEIEYDDDAVIYMSCDCPYAESGDYCKHMAATLFMWEKMDPSRKLTAEKLEKAVRSMGEDELREFVLAAARKDANLAALLCSSEEAGEAADRRTWGREIRAISKRYGGRDGFVDYYHAWDYTDELRDVLEQWEDLLEAGDAEDAFALTCDVFEEICTVDMDDSDGQLSLLFSYCNESWDAILEVADEILQKEMYDWFAEQWENETGWDSDLLSKYVFSGFTSEEITRKNLERLDRKIKDCGEEYRREHLLQQKFELLEKLPDAEKTLSDFYEEYGQIPAVRALFAERKWRNGDTDGAIRLWKQNRENAGTHYDAQKASEKLMEIYESLGNSEELLAELRFFVMTFYQNDLQYVERIKTMVPEAEWETIREEVLEKLNCYLGNELLFSEKLYHRLLDRIIQTNDVGGMDRYAEYLNIEDPKAVRDFYYRYLQKAICVANDRNMYRQLIPYLKKLAGYPEGDGLAAALAEQWRQEYKRRRALMDELQKAGF